MLPMGTSINSVNNPVNNNDCILDFFIIGQNYMAILILNDLEILEIVNCHVFFISLILVDSYKLIDKHSVFDLHLYIFMGRASTFG